MNIDIENCPCGKDQGSPETQIFLVYKNLLKILGFG